MTHPSRVRERQWLDEEVIQYVTILIDKMQSRLYSRGVPSNSDILESMMQRLKHECQWLNRTREEMRELREAYNRFVDLRDEQVKHEQRTERILAILGADLAKEAGEADQDNQIKHVDVPPVEALRDETPLWMMMEEYLRHVQEARLTEMEDFLQSSVRIKEANRFAMESALKRHPEVFKVRKKGREKFVSLKQRKE